MKQNKQKIKEKDKKAIKEIKQILKEQAKILKRLSKLTFNMGYDIGTAYIQTAEKNLKEARRYL